MGSKYGINYMREAAIQCLENEYPHNFDKFEAAISSRGYGFECANAKMNYYGSEIDYIKLAYEFSITRALPLLFYVTSDWGSTSICGLERKEVGTGNPIDGGGITSLAGELLKMHVTGKQKLIGL
jgi:hypothetical protein